MLGVLAALISSLPTGLFPCAQVLSSGWYPETSSCTGMIKREINDLKSHWVLQEYKGADKYIVVPVVAEAIRLVGSLELN